MRVKYWEVERDKSVKRFFAISKELEDRWTRYSNLGSQIIYGFFTELVVKKWAVILCPIHKVSFVIVKYCIYYAVKLLVFLFTISRVSVPITADRKSRRLLKLKKKILR